MSGTITLLMRRPFFVKFFEKGPFFGRRRLVFCPSESSSASYFSMQLCGASEEDDWEEKSLIILFFFLILVISSSPPSKDSSSFPFSLLVPFLVPRRLANRPAFPRLAAARRCLASSIAAAFVGVALPWDPIAPVAAVAVGVAGRSPPSIPPSLSVELSRMT